MFEVRQTAEFSRWLAALSDTVGRAQIGCPGEEGEEGEETEMTTKVNPNVARKLGVRRFDASEYLRHEADIAAYLEAAAAEEDPRVLAAALGDVARARGMSELARKTGITREALYRSLSAEGNPELSTLTRVLRALGMRLTIQPAAT